MKFKQKVQLYSLTVEAVEDLQIGQYIYVEVLNKTVRYIGILDGIVQVLSTNIGNQSKLKNCRDFINDQKKTPIQLLLW
jgi:hypothetical protein